MVLLLIVLNDPRYLEDVLSALVEVGITQATLVDSTAMGQALAEHVPIFAGLRHELWNRPYTKLILARLEKEEVVDELLEILKEVDVDFEEGKAGMLLTIPVSRSVGSTVTF